jgi:hypothetical protein
MTHSFPFPLSWLSFCIVFREEVAEPIEAALPRRDPLRNPLLGELEGRRLDVARAYPTDLLGPDDAALFEDSKVLTDGGQRHVERLRQVADRPRSGAQALKDRAASRLGERVKDAIDGAIV